MRAPILDQPSIGVAHGHEEKVDWYHGDNRPIWIVDIAHSKQSVNDRDIGFDEADPVVGERRLCRAVDGLLRLADCRTLAFNSPPRRRRLVLMSRRYRRQPSLFLAGCFPLSIASRSILAGWGKSSTSRPGEKPLTRRLLSVLAAAKQHLGSLDRVTRVARLGVFIATSGDFFDQPRVADAVSGLFRDVFGIEKTSVRVVIGVASLPLGVPIALDVIFEAAE